MTVGVLKKPIVTSPVITASMPCGAPLYGTCTSCVPVIWPNSTPDKWWLVPLPPDEKVSSPGLRLRGRDDVARLGRRIGRGTIITFDTPPTNAIGAKSLRSRSPACCTAPG